MTESGRGLGLEAEGEEHPLDNILAMDEPEQETVEEPAAETPETEEPPAPEQAEPEPEAETPDEPPAGSADPEPPRLLAGRFDSVEKLEESYKEAQRWATREAQRRAETERQLNEFKTRVEPLLPHLQRLAAEQQAPAQLTDEVGDLDPAKVQDQLAQIRLEAQQTAQAQAQRMLAEQQQQSAQAEAARHIDDFRKAHPDITGSPVEADMVRLFNEYRTEAEDFRPTRENLEAVHALASDPRVKGMLDALNLFPDPEYVEVARELVDKPELARIVLAHPHVIDAPRGMEWARSQVTVEVAAPTTQDPQRSQDAKRRAFVEKGGSGAPASSAPRAGWESFVEEMQSLDSRDGEGHSRTLGL